jgi:hypothetical protein
LLWLFVTGRLKDGVVIEQARAQLQSFWPEVHLATASTETPGLRRLFWPFLSHSVYALANMAYSSHGGNCRSLGLTLIGFATPTGKEIVKTIVDKLLS